MLVTRHFVTVLDNKIRIRWMVLACEIKTSIYCWNSKCPPISFSWHNRCFNLSIINISCLVPVKKKNDWIIYVWSRVSMYSSKDQCRFLVDSVTNICKGVLNFVTVWWSFKVEDYQCQFLYPHCLYLYTYYPWYWVFFPHECSKF